MEMIKVMIMVMIIIDMSMMMIVTDDDYCSVAIIISYLSIYLMNE